jgi:hypothetical protein
MMVFFRKESLFHSGVFRTMRSRQGPVCLPKASEEVREPNNLRALGSGRHFRTGNPGYNQCNYGM